MKHLTLLAALALALAFAAPSAADAKSKKKRWSKHHQYHGATYRCPPGFRGVDCSTVSARDPDPRLRGQIISDFRRGVDIPGNGR